VCASMTGSRVLISCVFLFFMAMFSLAAPSPTKIVAFYEPGFPAADTGAISADQLRSAFPQITLASADELGHALRQPDTRLLVLPYGSAFPESAWEDVYAFLQQGGNLLVLGGRPFTRSAFHDCSGWHLRDYSVRFTRPLMIDQYQETPGSDGMSFVSNPEIPLPVPQFSWKRAFSPVIRLSAVDLYKRGGSAGSIDARLDALAWGVKDGRKLAAPIIQVDHLRNGFDGGRWVFVNAEIDADFFSGAHRDFIKQLTWRAARGSEAFSVRPTFPLYLPDEPIQLNISWQGSQTSAAPLMVKIAIFPESEPANRTELNASVSTEPVLVPAPKGRGLYVIEARLLESDHVRAIYHSGFWIRDEAYLRSGPRLTVNRDYFELDGRPLAVVGTTYMSSEVQRLYFEYPNVYVWDRDLRQISQAGLNMIRTGWWTGWDKFCNENGEPYERTLRTLEAYLMTARKNGLPVQFNFLAFLPDVLGGVNAYLDPAAVRRQRTLIASVVSRFHDVPWLAWDFINEPSISQHLWTMRPNGDAIELARWNEWLSRRYPDRAALAATWNVPASGVPGVVPLPEESEFGQRGMYVGHNSLKVYDFFLFAQDVFMDWLKTMRDAVRETGSQQLITVGQDEGGIQDRLSPAYWGQFVDFTTNHSWWQNDFVLWDSLFAKQPGQAMLIQETGLQRELNLDETARRTPESEAALLERKVALSFVQGSGAIEWLWNTNSYMTESNETPIGAVRTDATEKPEATVMRAYAQFARSLSGHLRNPERPAIAIISSQAAQFSVITDLQLDAQRNSVRALAYYARLAPYAIAENQIQKLGTPRLAILPSPQALASKTWEVLLKYVEAGGNLLITGSVNRDEHWHEVNRLAPLKTDARTEPLTYHNASIVLNGRSISLSFDQTRQTWLESLRFADGSTMKEIPFGKGRLYWTAYPIELAEGSDAAAELYRYVARRVGLVPAFDLQAPLSPGVLVYPAVLEDSVLYVMTSDNAEDATIDLRDKLTGVRVSLNLPAGHAALAVIGRKEKSVIAKYGF
jgi:hypothetical protein